MTDKNYLSLFAKSFNWAGFFLPRNIYNDCSKPYAFVWLSSAFSYLQVGFKGGVQDLQISKFCINSKIEIIALQEIAQSLLSDAFYLKFNGRLVPKLWSFKVGKSHTVGCFSYTFVYGENGHPVIFSYFPLNYFTVQ